MATNGTVQNSPNPNRMSTASVSLPPLQNPPAATTPELTITTPFQITTDVSATAELSAVVDELLNSLSNKFAGVSSEIFAKSALRQAPPFPESDRGGIFWEDSH
jgi:heat shock factor-binding protein 1